MPAASERRIPRGVVVAIALATLLLAASTRHAHAQDVEVCRKLYMTGQYAAAAEMAQQAVDNHAFGHDWRILLAESMIATGRYDDAAIKMDGMLQRYPTSVRMLITAYDVYTLNGQAEDAQKMLTRIDQLGRSFGTEFWDANELTALGRAALKMGADPKQVLDLFFDVALKRNADARDAYLAAGQLALDKQDYALAAKRFTEGLKKFGDDPEMHFGMARAIYAEDRVAGVRALDAVFHLNPNHIPARLMTVDHMIDSEQYDPAVKTLDKIFEINPNHPDAWAYRAVLAHLDNNHEGELNARTHALKFAPKNPGVDYLIGRKLSQKYRFAEAAAYQRKAMEFDPAYLPAKIALAQDLLRLGQLDEGWKLVEEVQAADPYNVLAYNLATLKDQLANFTTIKTPYFDVRMDKREAKVYGDQVVELLTAAHDVLTKKYGLKLDERTIVEIYPDQRDFAIRTFGMPGGIGYLGVCFGNVVTANSPASVTSREVNWRSVLWHEYCHVVTLHLTKNKMPRWLSEGISVYEELERNPTWGQTMTPTYRQMVLNGELTPVGELSSAFLNPKSGTHVMFAYYESNLVVEYLVKTYGVEALRGILKDLGEGVKINDAISRHADRMDKIEAGFAAFVKRRAEDLAPLVDWTQPSPDEVNVHDTKTIDAWVAQHPTSFYGLMMQTQAMLAHDDLTQQDLETLVSILDKVIKLYPDCAELDGPYPALAEVYRRLDRTADERKTLETFAAINASSTATFGRLIELAEAKSEWDVVLKNAERYTAVNPLIATPYEPMARAAEALGKTDKAIDTYRRLLLLDTPDPAGVHYRLALLLRDKDPAAAKRHVLLALTEAPRFRDAHRLLLELTEKGDSE
ncbi:MAG: tetratricopeptide repeat protein [Phycisphaera sp.]|nr:tetratricopeptide repeat protein [Phycisphaera sp.]